MLNLWLMEENIFSSWSDFLEKCSVCPSMEEVNAYEASFEASEGSRIMRTAGDNAEITVEGVLTDKPSFMAFLFGSGNTTYKEIADAVKSADANEDIKKIKMVYNSAGGSASAEWLETMKVIASANKPVEAHIGSMSASAAYGLAAQSDTIIAKNEMSSVGSVGVVATVRPNKSIIEITGDNSPEKRPDPETEEGRAVISKRVNAIEKIFLDMVASGRGIDYETVVNDFGKGSVILAREAVTKNMIDRISGQEVNDAPAADSGLIKTEAIKMDLTEMKAKHPELVAQCVADGEKMERARVNAHLKLGASSNAMEVAIKAVTEGTVCDATAQADYMAAFMESMKPKADETPDVDAADGDTIVAEKAEKLDAVKKDDDKLADAVADEIDAQLGVDTHE